jgi:hypothetical protein
MALPVLAIVASSAVLPSEAEEQGGHALDADHEGSYLRAWWEEQRAQSKPSNSRKRSRTWEEGTLDTWLTDTESVVPNNAMSFRVPKRAERASIISYLRRLSTPWREYSELIRE